MSRGAIGRVGPFELHRPIGRGGMGVVYEAVEVESEHRVALKMLLDVTPSQILRLKNEFRSLAELVHPNLVALEQLFAADGEWFFTMELVEGVSFLEYVRPPHGGSLEEIDPIELLDTLEDPLAARPRPPDATVTGLIRATPRPTRPSIDRLRAALVQLATGIDAIHRADKLHRDLKPTNVRVTDEGRVVILDFGLVSALGRDEGDAAFAGTLLYMSPEQAAGAPLTFASDWYNFGVMLFEALTGRRPFEGGAVLLAKQLGPAPRVSSFAPDAPADLATLCDELLAIRPSLRPTGAEVLARLGACPPPLVWSRSRDSSFVGRAAELARLDQRLLALDRGRGAALLLHGPSGIGKSALLARFLARAESRGAVVLRGRCYERESLPFKALDSVIDAIAGFLRRTPTTAQQSLVPRHVRALARLFPVLLEVPAIRSAPGPTELEAGDPRELRRLAISAFVALLRRLADQHRVIVAIDDLQWGDADSGDLLAQLFDDLPPLLWLGAFATDDRASSELLPRLVERHRAAIEELELGPLDPTESRALALQLLRPEDVGHADQIAKDSAGIPMFVQELARHAFGPPLPLERALSRRLDLLEPEAERVLEVIAAAGRPIEAGLARTAAGVDTNEGRAAIDALRAAHLIRIRAVGLESYHELIRRAVLQRMTSDEVEDVHRRLAHALEGEGGAPDLLVHHWRAGGDPVRAGRHAVNAAKKAADALAFERAAYLYRLAIELADGESRVESRESRARSQIGSPDCRAESDPSSQLSTLDSRLSSLFVALGEACANAGRAADAAQCLLEAVRRGASERATLQSRAVGLMLTSGHLEPGLAELDRLLRSLGLRPLEGRRGVVRLLIERVRLRFTRVRSPGRIDPRELERIDACWSATTGLALIDMVLAADFHTENLVRSARSGDRYRYARALGMEAVLLGVVGGKGTQRAREVLIDAGALIAALDDLPLIGLLAAARGFVAMSSARWSEMLLEGQRAEQILCGQPSDSSWGLDLSRTLQLWALAALGRFDEVSTLAAPLVAESEARGDRYAANMLRSSPMVNLAWLAKDDTALAESYVEQEKRRWPRERFVLQNYWSVRAQSQIDLYRGDPMAAWHRYEETWPVLLRSTFLRVLHLRVHARGLRARSALAAGVMAKKPELIAIAVGEAKRLARDETYWPHAIALRIFALAALAKGDRALALEKLLRSEALYTELDMEVEVAASKWLRATLLGGGDALLESARATMQRRGIVDPARFTAVLTGWPLDL